MINKGFLFWGKTGLSFLFLFLIFTPFLDAKNLIIICPHKEIRLNVEIALTPEAQQKGLMFRKKMAQHAGMIFIYPEPSPIAMWMKNTFIPLDMIFATEEGSILAIHENSIPHSLTPIGPVENTIHVLEINGGLVKKHGITKSCRLIYEF